MLRILLQDICDIAFIILHELIVFNQRGTNYSRVKWAIARVVGSESW